MFSTDGESSLDTSNYQCKKNIDEEEAETEAMVRSLLPDDIPHPSLSGLTPPSPEVLIHVQTSRLDQEKEREVCGVCVVCVCMCMCVCMCVVWVCGVCVCGCVVCVCVCVCVSESIYLFCDKYVRVYVYRFVCKEVWKYLFAKTSNAIPTLPPDH